MQTPDRQEFRDVRDSLLRQRHGSSLYLVQGPSGVGKTTLVKALAENMTSEGWKVFFLSTQTADASFASLAQVLDRLIAEIAGKGKPSGSVQRPAEFCERFRQALGGFKGSSVLIVLDGLDELSFDFWSESKLIRIAAVLRNSPGCHLILASRPNLQIEQLALSIEPRKIPLAGLPLNQFRDVVLQLALPFGEDEIEELHSHIHGLPKALRLMACSPRVAFDKIKEHEPADIDKVYDVLYDLRLNHIFSSLDSAQEATALAILGFLTILREPVRLADLNDFIKACIPRSAPGSPRDLWCFLRDTDLVHLLDLPSPIDPYHVPSRPLRFVHQSLKDFCNHQFLGTKDKVRFHRQVSKAFQGLTSEMEGRNLLFHLVKGWEGNPEELAKQLCRVRWSKLLDCWNEQSAFLLDLGHAFEILDREQQGQVSEKIEAALSDRLSRRGHDKELDLYELACRMALSLPPGPFVRKLSEEIVTRPNDDEIVAVRQNELRTHLGRLPATSGGGNLRVLVDLWPGYYPLFAIEEELNREGIFLEVVESSKEKIDMLLKEQADLIATTPGCLLGAESMAIDRLRILGVLNQSVGADKILVDASQIDLDIHDWPVEPGQIARAPKMAARHSTSRMFLNWFLARIGLDDHLLDIKEGDDYLKGLLRAVDSGTVAVLSTWEPYASMLIKRNPDFRVACDTCRAPRLVVDLLVADSTRVSELATRPELEILGKLYDQAVQERRADQDDVIKKLCDRLRTSKEIYEIGWKGVQCFQRAQMKGFFADEGRELGKIFEEVAKAWGRPEQVDENRNMASGFRRCVKHLFDPPDLAHAWLSVPRVKSPKVFISYSWDGEEHCEWVNRFATFLHQKKGVETIFDRWGLAPGDLLRSFMEKGIRENEFVLIICTDQYRERADQRKGGVGVEVGLMADELRNPVNTRKFIPILRQGDAGCAVPSLLADLFYLDFRDPVPDTESYDRLIRLLYKIEANRRPPLGVSPFAGG